MIYPWLSPFLAALSNLVIGVFVNRSSLRSELRGAFTFLSVALVFWNLIFFVLYSVEDPELAYWLASIVRSGGLYLFPAVFHLGVALPQRTRSRWIYYLLYFDYLATFLLVLGNAGGFLVGGLQRVEWGYYSIPTHLYDFFTLYVIANFAGTILLLAHDYRTTNDPRMRLQLQFWVVGLGIGLPLGLTNLLPAYGVNVYPLGNLGSAAWSAAVAYAIVWHRLMDIEVVVAKAGAFVSAATALSIPAFILSVVLERRGDIAPEATFAVPLLFAMVGASLPAVQRFLERRLSSSLLREKQSQYEFLSRFGRSALGILNKDELVQSLCRATMEALDLESVSFFARDQRQGFFTLTDSLGEDSTVDPIESSHPLCTWLAKARGRPLLAAESTALQSVGDREAIAELSACYGWQAFMPIESGSTGIDGFLALGRRRNMRAFSAGDLDALAGVCDQAAIAFENARLYAQLKESEKIIDRSSRLSGLGTLAAGIAHEIRNPLVSIQTYFQLAPDRLDDEEFQSHFLSLAEEEVSRINRLIEQLLSYARSTSPDVGPVDLNDLVRRALILLKPQARNRRIELLVSVPDSKAIIQANSDQLLQVIINLGLNAIQATPEGAGDVRLEAKVVDSSVAEFWRLLVRDSGPGVDDDKKEEIFNPFYTTKDKGTGLGLAIAARIIADCGGSLSVEDDLGGGACFCVELPATEVPKELEGPSAGPHLEEDDDANPKVANFS